MSTKSFYWFKIIPFILFLLASFVLSNEANSYIGLGLILTIGILHGSNDLSIIIKNDKKRIRTIILYVLIAIFALALFILNPIILLLFFGITSCYHFGEQHLFLSIENKGKIFYFLSFFIGLSVLLVLFSLNIEETNNAINELFGFKVDKNQYYYLLIASYFITGFLFLNIKTQKRTKLINKYNLISVLLLIVIFYFCNLIIGFTFYFIFYHSLPSIEFQLQKIYGKISVSTLKKYLKATSLIWFTTIIFGFLLFYFTSNLTDSFIYFTLGFLIAIASSHTLLFHQFNNSK